MCENAGNTVKYNDLTAGGGTIGLHFRTSWIDIDLPEESKLHLTQCEGSISGKYNLGPVTLSSMIGGYGWYPDRIGLTAAAGIETYLSKIGAFYGSFIQAVNPHSPEEMYAGYRENRPVDDLQPLWRLREELPVKGAILPVSGSMGGEIGFKSMFGITEEFDRLSPARVLTIDLAVFQRRDKNPIYWTIEGDSIIAPKTAHDRTTVGWRGALHWHQNPFRASLKMIGMDREDLPERGVPVMIAEPTFRLMWELGWRQRYWGDDFEADVSLGGHYYNSFYSFADEAEWIKLGNAYPLDMKLSVRIRRFTLYWGMHNWNAYPYYLVPDYKMMHKEEYWGIHWLLID